MRILVVGRDFPTKENHMMGSFEYDQAKMLVRNGHKVYYLFVDLRSLRHWRKFGFVKQEVDGVSVVAMNIPIGRALPADVRDRLYAPLRKYQMKMFCRYFGTPDVVYVHYPALYPYEIFAPVQALGARVVGAEHWSKVQNRDLPVNITSATGPEQNILVWDLVLPPLWEMSDIPIRRISINIFPARKSSQKRNR